MAITLGQEWTKGKPKIRNFYLFLVFFGLMIEMCFLLGGVFYIGTIIQMNLPNK